MNPVELISDERLRECIHCGLCLSACPTYVETGAEADSPRGRIYLMRAVRHGEEDATPDVVEHLDACLGCRACEPACPSGVRYGELIEGGRAWVEARGKRPWPERLRRAAIHSVFPHPVRLRAALWLARGVRRMGLWDLVSRVSNAARLLPETPEPVDLPEVSPAEGDERGRVGLLAGCVARALFGETHRATVRVLNRNGWTVITPPPAGCCGALDLHAGRPGPARRRARRLLAAFPEDLDAIVVNAAGCGAAMKEYGRLLGRDPAEAERADRFAGRVRDVTEILAENELEPPVGRMEQRVVYHDACHLAHAQGVRQAPRELLDRIPGLERVELEESDMCCGSAGTYNLTEPEMAARLQRRKVERIIASGADCVASANPGCTLQIRAGLRAAGSTIRVAHPVELLDEAYRK